MTTPDDTIAIENVRPIERLDITLPPEGGVVVLRGANGSGKSSAIDAVDKLAKGSGRVQLRDGAPKGIVSGLGATINVGPACRRTGEIEVETLDSRLSLADLVDPGLVDPERNDAARIKALVEITGATVDAKTVSDVVGPSGASIKSDSSELLDAGDLVGFVSAARRDLHEKAREWEAVEKDARSKITVPDNPTKLSLDEAESAYEASISALRERHLAKNDAVRAQGDHEQWSKRVDDAAAAIKAEGELPDVTEIGKRLADAASARRGAIDRVEKLRAELDAAESERDEISHRHKMVAAEMQKAEETTTRVDRLLGITNSAGPDPVTDADLAKLDQSIADAEADMDAAVRVRDVARAMRDAEAQTESADRAATEAMALREAATNLESVLSKALRDERLRVKGGRLVTPTDRSDDELYADLSEGERWDLAIDLAESALSEIEGRRKLLTIPQSAWEGLAPALRDRIHQRAVKLGIHVITAAVSDGDLRAEEYAAPE